MPKILLVDDEDTFRKPLVKRLNMRGYETIDVDNGVDAIKAIRRESEIDVVLLDRKMPGVSGEQVLHDIKSFRPELQVIMLTAHASMESAMETGRLDAFSYLQKPVDFEELTETIEKARADKVHAMTRHEIPHVEKGSFKKWLIGTHNSRPGIIILGILLFTLMVYSPVPDRLLNLLSAEKTGQLSDLNMGYANYKSMSDGQTITEYFSKNSGVAKTVITENGARKTETMTSKKVGRKAKVMLGILIVAALFWASGAVPVGITALLVGTIMYLFEVLSPNKIAQAYAKDAVFFIFGVLAMA